MSHMTSYDLSIVGTVGLPAAYGGFETLVEQLTQRLSEHRTVQVFCSGKRHPNKVNRPKRLCGADLNYVEWDANGWQSMIYDFVSLWRAAGKSKTILVLGVSGCLMLPVLRLLSPHTRIVTNIDGLEWKRRKWGLIARIVLRLSEHVAVVYSHSVIADNRGIREYIFKSYHCGSHLIAYGGDQINSLLKNTPVNDGSNSTHSRFTAQNYFFAVCRIEPENNIAEILLAFANTPDANLVLVGNWSASAYARKLRAQYGDARNIEFKDPIYDQSRLHTLRSQAKAYVHGHSAGGTNPSLVEAMCAGVPILAYDVDYNRYTTYEQAVYWRDSGSLANLLRCTKDSSLREIANRMLEIARQHYTWSSVAGQYESVLFPGL